MDVGEKYGKTWSEAECLLAIWAYYKIDTNRAISKNRVYREVAELIGRTTSSVEYKVQNVSACDPRDRSEKPISKKGNYQGLLKELFNKHGGDYEFLERVREEVQNLHDQGFPKASASDISIGHDGFLIEEGAIARYSQRRRKRSRRLVEAAREHYRSLNGKGLLACAVCGLFFDDIIGRVIIQIHHLEPISERRTCKPAGLREALEMVRPLCPTCHSLIHMQKPPLTVEGAKRIRSIYSGFVE